MQVSGSHEHIPCEQRPLDQVLGEWRAGAGRQGGSTADVSMIMLYSAGDHKEKCLGKCT